MRKKLGLTPSDKIAVTLPDWPKDWEPQIKQKVGAVEVVKGESLKVIKI
jgi:hypothetical protein